MAGTTPNVQRRSYRLSPRAGELFTCPIAVRPRNAERPCLSVEAMRRAVRHRMKGETERTASVRCLNRATDMRRRFVQPFDMDTLKAAIQGARADCGEVRDAILSCTFKPRERAFTRLINMCGRQKESRKALEVFATMRECPNVRPNTYTYSALISACNNAGDWDLAIEIFRRMKEAAASDPGCRPNQVTYNAIITASERGGRYDVCLSCFYDMCRCFGSPDSGIYCVAINATIRLGRWREGEKLLADMHDQDLVANVGVYIAMIEHHATEAEWHPALDLFLTMQMLGQPVDERCCQALMTALVAGQQAEMAYQLIRSMWANDLTVDTSMYMAALHLMKAAAMWEEMLEVLDSIDLSMPPDDVASDLRHSEPEGDNNLLHRLESIAEQIGCVDSGEGKCGGGCKANTASS